MREWWMVEMTAINKKGNTYTKCYRFDDHVSAVRSILTYNVKRNYELIEVKMYKDWSLI